MSPRRPKAFAVLGWAALGTIIVAAGLLTLFIIGDTVGPLGFVTGGVLAAIPVFPVVATYLWLDRYEAEPKLLLLFAFGWGAAVATLGALIFNSVSAVMIASAGENADLITPVLVAPVVEESFKGVLVLMILLLRRREFNGIVDGLVYAGMVGIGFAFVENILYLGRMMNDEALREYGLSGVGFLFILRCIVSPFAHPMFTAATGIGVGIASRTPNPAVKVLAPVTGWMVAVLLHGVWNFSASLGSAFFLLFVVVQVPLFAGFVVMAVLARRREGRLITEHLAIYVQTGWMASGEVGMLGSLRARREARNWAARTGGPAARAAMRDFQELGSELAFLRERITRGTSSADAQQVEYALLSSMTQLRRSFTPG
jgi:RsiW-degrading membrane proteinase PrsW (M82 family)